MKGKGVTIIGGGDNLESTVARAGSKLAKLISSSDSVIGQKGMTGEAGDHEAILPMRLELGRSRFDLGIAPARTPKGALR